MSWLKRERELVYQVVEVEKPRVNPVLDADAAAAVSSLQSHPGFQYLLNKLRLQRAQLKTIVSTTRQESLRDVEFLQSGVAWTGWLEDQLMKAIGYKSDVPSYQEPLEAEREAFEQLQETIELLK